MLVDGLDEAAPEGECLRVSAVVQVDADVHLGGLVLLEGLLAERADLLLGQLDIF